MVRGFSFSGTLLVAGCALFTAGCASAMPPSNWGLGGAPLDIARARYSRGDIIVDLMEDGRVLVNGQYELSVDRGGRVFDVEAEPVALLEADGRLIGPDDRLLGVIGSEHAAAPDAPNAMLSLMPSGEVIRYDDEGDRQSYGVWMGCRVTPRTQQTCTLLTYLFALRGNYGNGSGGPISVGIGVGVGVGFGR